MGTVNICSWGFMADGSALQPAQGRERLHLPSGYERPRS